MTEERNDIAELGTYSGMFAEYVAAQSWIGPAETPLVFHLRKLCTHLDTEGLGNAAMSSAYLKALANLENRRPKTPGSSDAVHPDQLSIYDELD